jgi:hypothetical protein
MEFQQENLSKSSQWEEKWQNKYWQPSADMCYTATSTDDAAPLLVFAHQKIQVFCVHA